MYLLSAHQNPVGLDIHKNNPNLDHFISHNYYYTDTYYLAVPLRTANLEDKSLYKAFFTNIAFCNSNGHKLLHPCSVIPSFFRFFYMGHTRPLFRSFSSFQTLQFLQQIYGFEPTTIASPPITTRAGLPPNKIK